MEGKELARVMLANRKHLSDAHQSQVEQHSTSLKWQHAAQQAFFPGQVDDMGFLTIYIYIFIYIIII